MSVKGRLDLPPDFTHKIPGFGRAWMLKGGVNSFLTDHYGIGWSEAMARVVIPVRGRNAELIAVQSRAVMDGQKPKYLNKAGWIGASPLFWSDDDVMLQEPIGDWGVLTEDILSTIRVGRIQPAVASLGTSLNHRAAANIIKYHPRMLVWYDSDEAGVKGAAKARRTFELQGAEVRVIKTELDPKAYDNETIAQIIKDYTDD